MFDPHLAARVRRALSARAPFEEKAMFGGVYFLVGGHLATGVAGEELVARLAPSEHAALLREPHVRAFDVGARPMAGWVLVAPEAVERDGDLDAWVARAVAHARSQPPKATKPPKPRAPGARGARRP